MRLEDVMVQGVVAAIIDLVAVAEVGRRAVKRRVREVRECTVYLMW